MFLIEEDFELTEPIRFLILVPFLKVFNNFSKFVGFKWENINTYYLKLILLILRIEYENA
jgi:hypothetical protein